MPNIKTLGFMFSDKKIFFMFSLCKPKHVAPGAGPFWSKGHNLNKLGFTQIFFFIFFTIYAYVKHVNPAKGHLWP